MKINYIIISILLFALFIFAHNTYITAIAYEDAYTKSIDNNSDEVVNVVSSFFGISNSKVEEEENNNEEILNKLKKEADDALYYFLILLALSFLSYFTLKAVYFVIYLHLVSLLCLIYGVFTPIFLIFVHKDLGFTKITLEFESNNIISSIDKLFLQNNYFVGGIILLFSIIFPLLKTIILLISVNGKFQTLSNFLTYIGKWSMSDVFVLAIFLVYLSPSPSSPIHTELEVGFYLFFSYVVLSIFASSIQKNISRTS